jgi:hypothetical protein
MYIYIYIYIYINRSLIWSIVVISVYIHIYINMNIYIYRSVILSIMVISIGTATTCSFTPQLNLLGTYTYIYIYMYMYKYLYNVYIFMHVCLRMKIGICIIIYLLILVLSHPRNLSAIAQNTECKIKMKSTLPKSRKRIFFFVILGECFSFCILYSVFCAIADKFQLNLLGMYTYLYNV